MVDALMMLEHLFMLPSCRALTCSGMRVSFPEVSRITIAGTSMATMSHLPHTPVVMSGLHLTLAEAMTHRQSLTGDCRHMQHHHLWRLGSSICMHTQTMTQCTGWV